VRLVLGGIVGSGDAAGQARNADSNLSVDQKILEALLDRGK
jgi:hypothetical protein